MRKRIVFALILTVAFAGAVWALVRFQVNRWNRLNELAANVAPPANNATAEAWAAAVEKAKAARLEESGALVIPPELRHYSERYWFLATQVAEIEKYKVHTCQDYLDLAVLIQRGEMVSVPVVTDTYVLLGVGERADDSAFTRYEEEEKDPLDDSYLLPQPQERLGDYQSVQTLAKNFGGRSYNLDDPTERQALKVNMLQSLRPEALKVLEQVASVYQRQFNRQLPVSSLVRPEQYQHALRRVNRNAVTIDSPPHSTGLAFDIDYRYMSATEQTFLMAELARLKTEGRIEVIRERNANYHVFAFINGTRPSDELIKASLEKAGAPVEEAHHPEKAPPKAKSKTVKARKQPARAKSSGKRTRRRR
jgi:hypothetical protein